MTRTMTFHDLRTILVDCSGLDDGVDLSERHLDTQLDSLGYDSLAVLETAARIKHEFGVDIPDEEVAELHTPRQILDRVNGSPCYAEHDIEVAAGPAEVFDLLADVTLWPVIFEPTVFTRLLERTDDSDRFQIWATAPGGEINYWVSRRTLDRTTGLITFAQDRDSPLFGFMGGRWRCEPLGPGRARVALGHEFRPRPEEPDAEARIRDGLAHNDGRELDALRVVAALPGGAASLLVSVSETVRLGGTAEQAHEFIWAAQEWPNRLPHVASVAVRPLEGNGQDLIMSTRTPDGGEHTTRSVRVVLPDRSIAYKQTVAPRGLLGHSGLWEFLQDESGASIRSSHTALIDPVAAAEMFGDRPIPEIAERVRAALAANSRTTMEHAGAATTRAA